MRKAVPLCFGQGVDALGFDWVLRGQDQERVGQWTGLATDADLRSAMTSSSALWTLAGARLISSVRTRLAKTGPHSMSNRSSDARQILVPTEVRGQQIGSELEPDEAPADDL